MIFKSLDFKWSKKKADYDIYKREILTNVFVFIDCVCVCVCVMYWIWGYLPKMPLGKLPISRNWDNDGDGQLNICYPAIERRILFALRIYIVKWFLYLQNNNKAEGHFPFKFLPIFPTAYFPKNFLTRDQCTHARSHVLRSWGWRWLRVVLVPRFVSEIP